MPKTVLVVDDSTSMRQMVSFTMKEAGFDVIEAGNGQEAISRVQGKPVNLVITDLNMPVMDGMTLIRQLRAKAEFKLRRSSCLRRSRSRRRSWRERPPGRPDGSSSRSIPSNCCKLSPRWSAKQRQPSCKSI